MIIRDAFQGFYSCFWSRKFMTGDRNIWVRNGADAVDA